MFVRSRQFETLLCRLFCLVIIFSTLLIRFDTWLVQTGVCVCVCVNFIYTCIIIYNTLVRCTVTEYINRVAEKKNQLNFDLGLWLQQTGRGGDDNNKIIKHNKRKLDFWSRPNWSSVSLFSVVYDDVRRTIYWCCRTLWPFGHCPCVTSF